jgi:hypothetical protein
LTHLDRMGGSEARRIQQTWPLWDQGRQFDLGHVLNGAITDVIAPSHVGSLTVQHTGLWECDLTDNRLIWSGGVYDIFGIARSAEIKREEVIAFYVEESRVLLERIRAHAIRRQCGFTIDVEVCAAAVGERRSIRIIAAPVCDGDRVTRLHGVKLII